MDASSKRQKVRGMTDEVHQFHPLLQALLPRLPGIERVDYTHGNAEFGADFLLYRRDATFGDTEYIGVIAKTGDLKQDGIGEVDRQFDEIGTRRYALDGKKEVFVAEVWLASSGTVSKNAQDRIYDKFRSKKIKFIDCDRLVELVDRHLADFWTDVKLAVSEYLTRTREQNEQADRALTIIPIADRPLYVEQDLFETYGTKYSQAELQRSARRLPVDVHAAIRNNRFLLIEGGMGTGKSKLLRNLVKKYAEPQTYLQTGFIPVPVRYSELSQRFDLDINALLSERMGPLARPSDIKALPLVLIDAFDEQAADAEAQIGAMERLHKQVEDSSDLRVVMTTRFLAGSISDSGCLGRCKRLEIAPLTLAKTLKLLQEICTSLNISGRIIEDIRRSALFKSLPRTPIAAILLGRLLKENHKDLPSNLTELYSKYVELALGRWDVDKGLESQLEYEITDRVLMTTAGHVIENSLSSIPAESLKNSVAEYIRSRNLPVDPDLLFAKMTSRSEILQLDNVARTAYFTHRTFAEYLYAKSRRLGSPLPVDHRAFQLYWMNVFFFYIGLLKDCPDVIAELVALKPADEGEAWLKLINIPNYFLAAYQSPYAVIEDNLHKMVMLAAKMYQQIADGKIPSLFSSLSEIGLLWWTQLVIRESYAFDHFQRAIESAILHIEDSSEDRETKAYALFLLSVIEMELGNNEAFDYLIENYKTALPVRLRFGLYYEGKRVVDAGRLLKKQLRHLRKDLQGIGKDAIEILHNRAIGSVKAART